MVSNTAKKLAPTIITILQGSGRKHVCQRSGGSHRIIGRSISVINSAKPLAEIDDAVPAVSQTQFQLATPANAKAAPTAAKKIALADQTKHPAALSLQDASDKAACASGVHATLEILLEPYAAPRKKVAPAPAVTLVILFLRKTAAWADPAAASMKRMSFRPKKAFEEKIVFIPSITYCPGYALLNSKMTLYIYIVSSSNLDNNNKNALVHCAPTSDGWFAVTNGALSYACEEFFFFIGQIPWRQLLKNSECHLEHFWNGVNWPCEIWMTHRDRPGCTYMKLGHECIWPEILDELISFLRPFWLKEPSSPPSDELSLWIVDGVDWQLAKKYGTI